MKHICELFLFRMKAKIMFFLIIIVFFACHRPSLQPINGVFPDLTVVGSMEHRSESGIGALLPWADKLYMIGYVAHIKGSRIGLYEISSDMTMRKHPQSVTGTFANRYTQRDPDIAVIGPHLINKNGLVRTYKELSKHRLTATMRHLTDPQNKVLFLTMEGLLFEASINNDMAVTLLFDLVKELEIPDTVQPHFKGGYTGNGRVIVANNSYDQLDYLNVVHGGRLAEWDGKKWTIIERTAFVEVNGKMSEMKGRSVYGNPIFATGWDNKSVILKSYNEKTRKWDSYRLPKGSHSFDHTWNTEWMRIREAQTERFIMDMFGIFYELPMMAYNGDIWGIRPISYHLRIVPDFCFWRGMFVMAGDQTDYGVGQPQSGLLFQNIDDLWKYGKPTGWGSLWLNEDVQLGQISDPYLMTGFDKKAVHFMNNSGGKATIEIQVDISGNGKWQKHYDITADGRALATYIFPDGYSAHWMRVVAKNGINATVTVFYN